MSNTLENIIQNDYSSKYVLVIDERSFYPKYDSDNLSIKEKYTTSLPPGAAQLAGSSNPGATATNIDPFRQCTSRIWTYKSNTGAKPKSAAFLTTQTMQSTNKALPKGYFEGGSFDAFNAIEYEDVTLQWQEYFPAGSFADSLRLPRKATRIKIKLFEEDFLGNQISVANLTTPMNAKANGVGEILSLTDEVFAGEYALAQSNQKIFKDDYGSNSLMGPYKNWYAIKKSKLEVYNAEEGGLTNLYGLQNNENGLAYAKNAWQNYFTKFLNKSLEDNRFMSFYNPYTNDYTYYDFGRHSYESSEFSMDLPVSIEAQKLSSDADKSSLYADIKPEYNYHSKMYESATMLDVYETVDGSQEILDERNLPLIYEVPLGDNADDTPSSEADEVYGSKYQFEKFGFKIMNCEYIPITEGKNTNIVLYQDNKEYLQIYDNIKTQFPFYVNLEFKTEAKNDFTAIFNKYGLTSKLISTVINSLRNDDGTASSVFPDKEAPIEGARGYYDPLDDLAKYRDDSGAANICKEEIYSIKEKRQMHKVMPLSFYSENTPDELKNEPVQLSNPFSTREYNINRWLDGYLKHLTTLTSSPFNGVSKTGNYEYWEAKIINLSLNSKFTNVFKDSGAEKFFSGGDIFDILNASIFVGKYRSIVDKRARSYDQILSTGGTEADLSSPEPGAPLKTSIGAYNETLFYRIEKVALNDDGSPDSNYAAQNIWIVRPNPENNNSNIMKYIDTQVKYNKNYQYTIYAYQLVVGTKYGIQFANKINLIGAQAGLDLVPEETKSKINKWRLGIENSVLMAGPFYDSDQEIGKYTTNLTYGPLDGDQYSLTQEDVAQIFSNKPLVQDPYKSQEKTESLLMFDAICEPDVKLVEMPFYKKRVVVTDAPPVAPNIDIVPLKGEKNTIKINFSPNTVDREIEPITIGSNDPARNAFLKIRKAQNRHLLKPDAAPQSIVTTTGVSATVSYNEDYLLPPSFYVEPKIMFKSDDSAIGYQIFRSSEPPKHYNDFADNIYTQIDAMKISSFKDQIDTNKKYYYVFRSMDAHQNFSNPSPVYQVEMVENSGVTYPIISIYEFEKEAVNIKSKSFKKHIKIDAQMLQSFVDYKASGLLNDDGEKVTSLGPENTSDSISLGVHAEKDAVFSANNDEENLSPLNTGPKRFLFRIKSKHTGKMLDLRVAFKTKPVGASGQEVVTCSTEGAQANNFGEVV